MGLSSVMIYLLDYFDGLCTKNVSMINEHKHAISEKKNPKITPPSPPPPPTNALLTANSRQHL